VTALVVAIFALTYLGMALGRLPGLRIDRAGIAVVAAAALLAAGAVGERQALAAIDGRTLVVLFALMIVSAQFAAAGSYEVCARRLVATARRPTVLLAGVVVVAGGLSAVLANDVVVFAMTLVLCSGLARQGRDPRPFLVALAAASNAGSAATVIGNPQNILIGQAGYLDFLAFLQACAPPAVAALLVVFIVVRLVWRRHFGSAATDPVRPNPAPPPAHDRWQMAKGVAAVAAVIAVFVSPVDAPLGALSVAALLLLSRRLASRDMLGAVDWHLLLLFAGLFVVTGAMSATGLTAAALDLLRHEVGDPTALRVLGPMLLALSNTVGNVPAVILLLQLLPDLEPAALYRIAVLSTLAGNFLLVGSLANLIVAERAAQAGVRLGFGDFARAGVPIALVSMGLAAGWFALLQP